MTVCSFPQLFVGQSAMLSALSQYSAAAEPCRLPTFSPPAVTRQCSVDLFAAVDMKGTIAAERLLYSDTVG